MRLIIFLTIHNLELKVVDKNTLSFNCHCSKGTYIRSLARDIGLFLDQYPYNHYHHVNNLPWALLIGARLYRGFSQGIQGKANNGYGPSFKSFPIFSLWNNVVKRSFFSMRMWIWLKDQISFDIQMYLRFHVYSTV
ncbi:hypothetical protein N9K77_00325 [bacterium]|nr:hypothetical protein [bacterium]